MTEQSEETEVVSVTIDEDNTIRVILCRGEARASGAFHSSGLPLKRSESQIFWAMVDMVAGAVGTPHHEKPLIAALCILRLSRMEFDEDGQSLLT